VLTVQFELMSQWDDSFVEYLDWSKQDAVDCFNSAHAWNEKTRPSIFGGNTTMIPNFSLLKRQRACGTGQHSGHWLSKPVTAQPLYSRRHIKVELKRNQCV